VKKSVLVLTCIFFLFPLFAFDVELSLLPQYDFYINSSFNNFFSGTASFDLLPFTIRSRDKIIFSLQGGVSALNAPTMQTSPLYYADIAAGYNYRINDRLEATFSGFSGIWKLGLETKDKTLKESGILAGARLGLDFYAFPELKVGLFTGFTDFIYKPDNLAIKIDAGISIRYNMNKGLFNKSKIELDDLAVEPIFPVFFSYYYDNSFGTAYFYNGEENTIKNVKIYIFIEEYMSVPSLCGFKGSVKPGETFESDLTAFLNERILTSFSSHDVDAKIIVSYNSLGKLFTFDKNIRLTALSRNSMSWADDRRAAAFVSVHDGTAGKIARLSKSIILKYPTKDATQNISFARGIFASLKSYGLSYVKDPANGFYIEGENIDFLQFPFQTLVYHGGDCDDLSILNCALLESIGIRTAFVTIPGHIFIAFDSGVSPEEAPEKLKQTRYIIYNDTVWIPYEITLIQQSFNLAIETGYTQIKKALSDETAQIYPLHDAWKLYKPVSVPESDVDIELPSVQNILKNLY
jgi:hypothetical protein